MAHPRLAGLLVLATLIAVPAVPAQPPPASFEAIQQLLDETSIETKHFRQEMPLGKFLDALQKQLPKGKKLALRIDNEAFGAESGRVAATPVLLPPGPAKTSLRRALEVAVARIKPAADYGIGAAEVTITTPQRAACTFVHDIRPHLTKPARKDETARAKELIRTVVHALEQSGGRPPAAGHEEIEIRNGARLAVRATPARHALIAETLHALRRLGDLAVIVKARLYEVDDAFYQKLKSAKRVPLEEQERQFLAGGPVAGDDVWKFLDKQTVVLAGEEVKANDGARAALLSRHRAVSCLPSPEQVGRGEKGRQIVLEGVSFTAGIQVSWDRRSVRVLLTEKAAEIQEIRKVKAWGQAPAAADDKVDAEIAFVRESSQVQVLEIPDGGSLLTPVAFRPESARAKGRWWVLGITTRIYIEEEEQHIRIGTLASILPAVVADVLNNPRLKAARETYGTAGEKRFALVNSDAWTWPEKFAADVPGYQVAPVSRTGKRLLGIRVDRHQEAAEGGNLTLAVTLVNAGGSANGAAVGGCTVRYTARLTDKGWAVELSEPPAP